MYYDDYSAETAYNENVVLPALRAWAASEAALPAYEKVELASAHLLNCHICTESGPVCWHGKRLVWAAREALGVQDKE